MVVTVLAIAVAAVIAGCSSGPEPSASGATEPGAHHLAMATPSGGGVRCAMHMPGERLSAADAMVVFDREHVCLAYVTVAAETPIMWHNSDTIDHRVTVVDSDDAVVATIDVPAMGMVTEPAPSRSGQYLYRLTAIETFVGTIEVQEP